MATGQDIILAQQMKDKDKLGDKGSMVPCNSTPPGLHFILLSALDNMPWSNRKALTIFRVYFSDSGIGRAP